MTLVEIGRSGRRHTDKHKMIKAMVKWYHYFGPEAWAIQDRKSGPEKWTNVIPLNLILLATRGDLPNSPLLLGKCFQRPECQLGVIRALSGQLGVTTSLCEKVVAA